MSKLFNNDLAVNSRTNEKGLLDLKTAIKALYAIDVGALSANTLNVPVYVEDTIRHLQIKQTKTSEAKLALIFGLRIMVPDRYLEILNTLIQKQKEADDKA